MDPQERIDSLFVHLGTGTAGLSGRKAGIISRAMLSRAWLRLGALEALLVMGGYFLVLLTAGWSRVIRPVSARRCTTATCRPRQ